MEAQRERILHATLRCISELGIERTSISAIRNEAGLSAGALYTHFANKEEIVLEALRFGSVGAACLPETWPEFVAAIASTADDGDFNFAVGARSQLQVFAMAIRAGDVHDMLKPLIQKALDVVVGHLQRMEATGRVKLRMTPLQTALAVGAIKDGVVWTGLALDRSREHIERDIVAALSCLVDAEGASPS